MTAETLVRSAMNEQSEWARVTSAVRQLRHAIDRTSRRVARANADWHDDPEADDYAEFHAPAAEQFPREVRDEAILDLVRHYLTEITLDEQNRASQC